MKAQINIEYWFAVDEDGQEWIFGDEPTRVMSQPGDTLKTGHWYGPDYAVPLPLGQIYEWTKVNLVWEDRPLWKVGPNYDPSPDTQPSEQ